MKNNVKKTSKASLSDLSQERDFSDVQIKNTDFNKFANNLIMNNQRGNVGSIASKTKSDLITLNPNALRQVWNKKGILKRYIEAPIEDCFKGGIEFKADNLNDDALKTLSSYFNNNVLDDFIDYACWDSLFGRAGFLIITSSLSGIDSLSEPFVKTKKNQDISFLALEGWRLGSAYGLGNKEADNIMALRSSNNVSIITKSAEKTINSLKIDSSRLMVLTGGRCDTITRQQLSGWGLSSIEAVTEAFDEYETAGQLIYELMEEGKVNVIKVEGLVNSLRAQKSFDGVMNYVNNITHLKKHIKTYVMDSKDDYSQTQSNLSGFSQAIETLMYKMCANLGIPDVKLFGKSGLGFSSGEETLSTYYEMVDSKFRMKYKQQLKDIGEILCYSVLGVEAKNLQVRFKPLQEIKPKDLEEINTSKQNRFKQQWEDGVITDLEYRQKLEREDLL